MNTKLKITLALAGLAAATQAAAQVTFYEGERFEGRSFTTARDVRNFGRNGLNDGAASAVVQGNRWEVCEEIRFGGSCMVLRPGRYPSLTSMGVDNGISSVRAIDRNARIDDSRYPGPPPRAQGQVTFYEREGFQGRSFTTEEQVANFDRFGFNDRASSLVVTGERWEICENAGFNGRCVVLRPGQYASLAAMGLNDRVSSVRTVAGDRRIDDNRYAPAPVAAADYRRRKDERLYEATVTSVRAVVGPPEQRCWVDREQAAAPARNNAVPGAIAGALIGGILGHQIGNGRGNDVATVGGAVAGGVVGANIGRNSGGQPAATQDVKRCESVPSQAATQFWDVTYNFRGQEHRMQVTAPPGPTVTVNEQGEPRA